MKYFVIALIAIIALSACSTAEKATKSDSWYDQNQGLKVSKQTSSIEFIHVHLSSTGEDEAQAKTAALMAFNDALKAKAEKVRLDLSTKNGGKFVEQSEFLMAWSGLQFSLNELKDTAEVKVQPLGEVFQVKVLITMPEETFNAQLKDFFSKKKVWADFYIENS